eukprot:RCo024234
MHRSGNQSSKRLLEEVAKVLPRPKHSSGSETADGEAEVLCHRCKRVLAHCTDLQLEDVVGGHQLATKLPWTAYPGLQASSEQECTSKGGAFFSCGVVCGGCGCPVGQVGPASLQRAL